MGVMKPQSLADVDLELAAAVEKKMAAIEARLIDSVSSKHVPVAEIASHLLLAGGKRFRPLLTVLASHFGDPNSPGITSAAVVVELTHMATLYHDDVMDEAPVRRGKESANSKWGNNVAILSGDFLFARASAILADLGPEAVRYQAKTFERMVTGQIMEISGPDADTDPVSHYLEVLADKTGSLIAAATHFGATLAGAPPHIAESLTSFGERIGVAFQLSDDLLDLTANESDLGKEIGIDLRAGVPTLPVLLAQASVEPGDEKLRQLLALTNRDEGQHLELLNLLQSSPYIEQSRHIMENWLDRAQADLALLPDGAPKEALVAISNGVGTRLS
jgi:heptaprenyl diphosphate synthase